MVETLIADLPSALRHWRRADPVLARQAARHPPESHEWARGRRTGFSSLAGAIVGQQVSIAAADTIYRRLALACGGRVTPQGVLRTGPEGLRACGLSTQKTAYVLDLASRVDSGELSFRRLAAAADEEVIESLTEVKGIGRWTAQMFLLFHMQRPDVLAPDDLGLQLAAAALYGISQKEAKAFLASRGPAWSPYGSLASLTLWHARRVAVQ